MSDVRYQMSDVRGQGSEKRHCEERSDEAIQRVARISEAQSTIRSA
ncbi:MAG: hypothetical protein FWC38_01630 [Proteobacteria bacterium]|nr:hypothetical protein [Pseudomonadota bacterium]